MWTPSCVKQRLYFIIFGPKNNRTIVEYKEKPFKTIPHLNILNSNASTHYTTKYIKLFVTSWKFKVLVNTKLVSPNHIRTCGEDEKLCKARTSSWRLKFVDVTDNLKSSSRQLSLQYWMYYYLLNPKLPSLSGRRGQGTQLMRYNLTGYSC